MTKLEKLSNFKIIAIISFFIFIFWGSILYILSGYVGMTLGHLLNSVITVIGAIFVWASLSFKYELGNEKKYQFMTPVLKNYVENRRHKETLMNLLVFFIGACLMIWGLSFFISQ